MASTTWQSINIVAFVAAIYMAIFWKKSNSSLWLVVVFQVQGTQVLGLYWGECLQSQPRCKHSFNSSLIFYCRCVSTEPMQKANYCLDRLIVSVVTSTEIRFSDVSCVHCMQETLIWCYVAMMLFVIEVGLKCESRDNSKGPTGVWIVFMKTSMGPNGIWNISNV